MSNKSLSSFCLHHFFQFTGILQQATISCASCATFDSAGVIGQWQIVSVPQENGVHEVRLERVADDGAAGGSTLHDDVSY